MTSGPTDWSAAREILGGGALSVILPVHNLGGEIVRNLESVESFLSSGGFAYELVPVDDGSDDASAAEIRRFAAGHPEVTTPVIIAQNAGKGNALKAGFRASRGELVLLLDGDLDIAPRMLPRFFEEMRRTGADIIVGSKRHPDSIVQYPWHRRLASFVYFSLVRFFIGLPITDTQTGMKLFRRRPLGEALDRMLVKTYAFDLELLAIAYGRGAKIAEAPVEISFGQKFGALKVRTVRDMGLDTLAVFYRLRLLRYYAKVEVPPPLEKPPRVSIVIACPSRSWMLDECLAAIGRQTFRDFEVIVLPDEQCEIPLPDGLDSNQLVVVPTGKVRPAEKRNLGMEKATGDVVAFIDDDAYPESRWLENAVKYFSEPSIGGVGGPGVTPPGDSFLAKCGGRVYENIFVSGNYRYRYLGGRVRLDVDDYPSCNLFVRTDILRKIGGYRVDFWPGEDTLLCEAIALGEHKRIVYDPWVLVYHHRRRLFAPHLRQLGRYGFHRGYFVKRFPATSCRPGYFVPTLFVLYLLALAGFFAYRHFIGGGTLGPIAALVASPLFFYLLLTCLSCFSFNPFKWVLTWMGVFLSHVWYGVQFARGLCARRAPCEFIGKDHAGGKKA